MDVVEADFATVMNTKRGRPPKNLQPSSTQPVTVATTQLLPSSKPELQLKLDIIWTNSDKIISSIF